MTNTVPVEDRLRRALQAVADQPVPVVALDGERPRGHRRSPTRHRTGLVGAAVVVAIGTVAVVYGPRSSTPGSPGVELRGP